MRGGLKKKGGGRKAAALAVVQPSARASEHRARAPAASRREGRAHRGLQGGGGGAAGKALARGAGGRAVGQETSDGGDQVRGEHCHVQPQKAAGQLCFGGPLGGAQAQGGVEAGVVDLGGAHKGAALRRPHLVCDEEQGRGAREPQGAGCWGSTGRCWRHSQSWTLVTPETRTVVFIATVVAVLPTRMVVTAGRGRHGGEACCARRPPSRRMHPHRSGRRSCCRAGSWCHRSARPLTRPS